MRHEVMATTYKRWIPVIGKIRVEAERVWSVALVTRVKLCLHLKQFPVVAKLAKINLQYSLVDQKNSHFLNERFYRNIK